MIRRPLLLAALGLAVLAPSAAAAEHVPGEVVVRYADDAALPGTAHASAVVAPRTRVVRTRPGQTVGERAAELRRVVGVADHDLAGHVLGRRGGRREDGEPVGCEQKRTTDHRGERGSGGERHP